MYFAMRYYGFKSCCFLLTVCLGSCLPDGDLCKWMNGRKYYIDVGESGIISVENATSVTNGRPDGPVPAASQPQIPQRCSVELITCPACHLEITVQKLAIPSCSGDKTCRCDFLWIKESAYSKSGREYCGFKDNGTADLMVYESKTKLVSVDFLYSGTYKEAFSLQFSAKKNIYFHKGGYDYYQNNNTGVIKSPNFPGGYPSDYSAEFILQNVDTTGFVQLIFTDFQLSLWSYVEIFDSNGSRVDVYNGNTFRPPALISTGPKLTVKFQANDEYPSTGFQAKYTFVSYPEKYWINRPSTDCGGFVDDYGGAITMMNMVPSNNLRAFDCIWLIRPRNSHVPDTQVSIRVAQFEEMGPKSTLSIRQGQHSDSPLLESVTTYQHHKMPRGQEFVVPATSGFYIRLVGYFTNKSHLAIIYTTFRYEGCYVATDFECENGRCIKNALRCDGFNHCGDGSDEASCYGVNPGTPIPEDANWWRTLTPNYYFPKQDGGSSGAGTNTLILVTSLAGLGMFVLTTVMILVKLHRQRNDDSISREILHTISGDLDIENSPSHQGGSDLPLYDPPPSYEDVIKLYQPPPPPYSTVNRGRTRPTRPTRSGGVDNRGYRSDGPNGERMHTRRSRTRQENTRHMVLKVALPEEETIMTSRMGMDRSGSGNAVIEQGRESQYEEATTSNEMDVVDATNSSLVGLLDSPTKCGSRAEPETPESCECEGACSCKLIGKRKAVNVAYLVNDGKMATGSHILNKAVISKKRSFRDMMQKSMGMSSSSAIIPHPASMTITMHPPRTKKGDPSNSRSNPSSPKSTDSPPAYSENLERGHSKSYYGHRRSSSGPSDINTTGHSSPDDVSKSSTTEIQADSSMSQVKHLASVLLDGLQSQFTFKSEDSQVVAPMATNEELDWTNILARKREDSSIENPKSEKTWAGSDTHPLLMNGSQQPSIVKFDDKSVSLSPNRNRQRE
ncbi:hypothetical protein JTE90_001836 [Oedothorax gibbosus]|uniref:CUB domain-containing protein n=1 Tax=Oedothorax gibbosus TaxID=931172 RepID=A0AAV6U601_9ARAC|nr:hypothetical protein JTE90_001836 [Oedothorax gibbosus]